jgi:hypothetical protein
MLRVFLSYHTPDRTIALNLKRAIEDALPGADVFVDQTHLRYGHLWQPSLFDAIAKAQAVLILVSHRAGDWQKFEYYEALDRKVKNDAFVLLPVIIADRTKGPAANLPGLEHGAHRARTAGEDCGGASGPRDDQAAGALARHQSLSRPRCAGGAGRRLLLRPR